MTIKTKYLSLLILITASLVFWGCGEKLDLGQFPLTNTGNPVTSSDTSYVQQTPVWTGFNAPEDILLGKEPLIYVADTKNNRVVQMDLSGVEIGSITVANPVALAQDNNFDILVIADTVLASTGDTLSVVYRIKLVSIGGNISNASLLRLLSSDYPTPLTSRKRRFTGISTYPDNSFIVSRRGPDNSNNLDPDNAIIKCKGVNSVTVELYTGFQVSGNGVYSIDRVSSVWAAGNNNFDFLITRNTSASGFKTEWFEYDNVNGAFNPRYLPEGNTDILKLEFGLPEDVTTDPNRNIFIVDAEKDSLYKFNSQGKLLKESFGGQGTGDNKLKAPKGVAFFNRVLYIADTGNNRIVRFKLSTDLQ
ncbi:MAG: hypothetical protein J0M18_04275 [Ignavibacteria bacterium]|jgi:hypothetical protein|nr:hypothetical protein [Ignavibacteria bacterium]